MPRQCELKVRSDLGNLETIAEFVMQAAERAGLTNHETFEVQMAVDEACANVMQHSYGDQDGDLNISCSYDDSCFTVTVLDQGKPFDPASIPEPDLTSPLDERRIGGLGVFFMRKMMDEIHFEFTDGEGNRLTMIKHIDLKKKSDSPETSQ